MSSYCSGGDCVVVEFLPNGNVVVRDSKQEGYVDKVKLVFSPEEWADFVEKVKNGEYDGPIQH